MLQHLSPKFEMAPGPAQREKRAALILNRFTRSLGVMYATDSVVEVLGITPEQLDGKAFYECIQVACHPDAIRAIESAKANDSIAYLRFMWRDPRHPEELEDTHSSSSDTDDGGGVPVREHSLPGAYPGSDNADVDMSMSPGQLPRMGNGSRTSSDTSAKGTVNSGTSMFDAYQQSRSSTSSVPPITDRRTRRGGSSRRSPRPANQPIMVEAVVSCSSDGLVVILRRVEEERMAEVAPGQDTGYQQSLFAAPWGAQPIVPGYQPEHGYAFNEQHLPHLRALEAHAAATNGPAQPAFMQAIREVAVFAWALTGINGTISGYARGEPRAPAVPPQGFPVWDRNAPADSIEPPYNQAMHKWAELHAKHTGAPAPPLQFSEREHDPVQYERQDTLVRNQYHNPEGPDRPGSYARRHLGRYMGEDGRGSGTARMGEQWLNGEVQTAQRPDVYRQQQQEVYRHLDQQQGRWGQQGAYGFQHQPQPQVNGTGPAQQQSFGLGPYGNAGQQQVPQNGFGAASQSNDNGNTNGGTSGYMTAASSGSNGASGYTNGHGNGMNGTNGTNGGSSMEASGSGSGSGSGNASGSGSGGERNQAASTSPERYLWY